MDAIDLPEDVIVQLARIGAADVAVGLVTAGPGPALADVAAAIKAGLDARLSGHSAVLIQVDRAASDEAAAQLALGLGGLPVVRVPHAPALDGDDDALEWSDAVHTVLRAGQAAQARAILMLSAEAAGHAARVAGRPRGARAEGRAAGSCSACTSAIATTAR